MAQKLIKPLPPTKQIRSKPFDASLQPFLKNPSERNTSMVIETENPGDPLCCCSQRLQNAVLWLLGRSANKCQWHVSVLLTSVRICSSSLKSKVVRFMEIEKSQINSSVIFPFVSSYLYISQTRRLKKKRKK